MRARILATLLAACASTPAFGQLVQFNNAGNFHTFIQQQGKFLKGIEDFEEAVGTGGFKQALPAPLQPGVPNTVGGVGFPNGLAEPNLRIQDNTDPGPNAPHLVPSGSNQALYVIGPGFIGSNSKKVGEDMFLQNVNVSIDLLFTPATHTAVGFNLSRFNGFGMAGWTISVWDVNNIMLGSFPVPAGPVEPTKSFWGVWSAVPIGRINIWDPIIAPEAIDNIEMWEVPAPGTAALLGLAGLLAARRRR